MSLIRKGGDIVTQAAPRLWGGIFLIAGCATGAGMLALPIATGGAGFFPSCSLLVLVWAFMAATGLLLAEVCQRTGCKGNLISIAGQILGRWGRIISWLVTLFLFYCLLTAYYVGMGTQLSCTIGAHFGWLASPEFFMVFCMLFTGGALLIGSRAVDWSNRILMIGLVVSYVILITLGLVTMDSTRLTYVDWTPTPFMMPIIMLSFAFQIVVPSVVEYASGNRRDLIIMILVGSAVPLVIYSAWQLVVLGNIPLDGPFGIHDSCARGLLATHSLRELCCNPSIVQAGEAFVLFAIITSLLTVGMGFRDFLADGLKMANVGWRKILLIVLALGPSICFSLQGPAIFLKALSLAGGFGVAILYGVLPPLMVWRARYKMGLPGTSLLPGGRIVLLFLALFATAIILIQGTSLWTC